MHAPFCKNCRFYYAPECRHDGAEPHRDRVDGAWPDADEMRASEHACGTSGYWHIPRPEPDEKGREQLHLWDAPMKAWEPNE